jgi:hypothetical protein
MALNWNGRSRSGEVDLFDIRTKWSVVWPNSPLYTALWGKMDPAESAIYNASRRAVEDASGVTV